MRLCANTGSRLHLIHPLGFEINDKRLRRAGLDYRDWAQVKEYADLDAFLHEVAPARLMACSTKADTCYTEVAYQAADAFLFGPETRGLPASVLQAQAASPALRIPMVAQSRSLNLSNAVSVILYEAWRQLDFGGAG